MPRTTSVSLGEQSGEPRTFDFDSFKARKRAEFEAG